MRLMREYLQAAIEEMERVSAQRHAERKLELTVPAGIGRQELEGTAENIRVTHGAGAASKGVAASVPSSREGS